MSRALFSAPAKEDLKEIAAYIHRDNPQAAKRVVQRIREVCKETLARLPGAGTMRDDLSPGLRCFSVGNYVVYFRGRNPVIFVRILHGAREVAPAMFS